MKTVQLSKLERNTKGLKFFPLFTLLGWGLIMFAAVVVLGLIVSSTGAAYWGEVPKQRVMRLPPALSWSAN